MPTLPYPGLPLAPTAPLPTHRLLAPTEPPEDSEAETNQLPVFVPSLAASTPTAVISVPRGAGWYTRLAVSIAIVLAVVAIVAIR